MNTTLQVMTITLFLFALGIGAYLVFLLYGRHKGVNDTTIETPTFWQSPIIETPNYGPVTPVSFEWETSSSGHATVRDANGVLRMISPMSEEELHVKNMLPGLFGATRLEVVHTPRDHAARERHRQVAQAGSVADALHYKDKWDMAQTEAITERENTDLALQKTVEHIQTIQRANPAVTKK